MASIANITLNTGAATPVAKIFNAMDASAALAVWANRDGGIATGMPSLTLAVKTADPKVETSVTRVTGKVILPVMEVISNNTNSGYQPLPKVAYTGMAEFSLVLPGRMSLDQRKDLLAYVRQYLSNAVITTAVEGFERPW